MQETLQLETTWLAVQTWDENYSNLKDTLFADLNLSSLRALGNRIAGMLAMRGVEDWSAWRQINVRLLHASLHLAYPSL